MLMKNLILTIYGVLNMCRLGTLQYFPLLITNPNHNNKLNPLIVAQEWLFNTGKTEGGAEIPLPKF